MQRLIEFVSVHAPPAADAARCFKYPYVTAQLFAEEPMVLIAQFFTPAHREDAKSLINELFSYLERAANTDESEGSRE
jgi:hypothetical protein